MDLFDKLKILTDGAKYDAVSYTHLIIVTYLV